VLGIRLGDSYWSMLDEAQERGTGSAEVECEAFQCHHGLVGGWLLQVWQLPPLLVDAVALHHDELVPDYGVDLPLLIGIADRLVNAAGGAAGEQVVAEARAVAPGLVAEGAGGRELVADLVQDEAAVALHWPRLRLGQWSARV